MGLPSTWNNFKMSPKSTRDSSASTNLPVLAAVTLRLFTSPSTPPSVLPLLLKRRLPLSLKAPNPIATRRLLFLTLNARTESVKRLPLPKRPRPRPKSTFIQNKSFGVKKKKKNFGEKKKKKKKKKS